MRNLVTSIRKLSYYYLIKQSDIDVFKDVFMMGDSSAY